MIDLLIVLAFVIRSGFLAHGIPHGLFSEDIVPDTEQLLGNFPQVYCHVGIIRAWLALYW